MKVKEEDNADPLLVTEVRKSNCGVALGKSTKSDHPKGKEQHCVVNDSVVCQKRKKPTLPGANNSSYQLPTGKKSYMFFVSMMEHQRATNQPNSKPECVKCGTVYDTWDQLGRHMRIKGHDTNCPRCPDRQFDRWPDYQKGGSQWQDITQMQVLRRSLRRHRSVGETSHAHPRQRLQVQ